MNLFLRKKEEQKIQLSNEEVIDLFSDTVYKVALSKMKNEADAQDVFQEVFLRYVKKQRSFDTLEHVKAWFIRVTINCCNDIFKNKQRKPTVELVVDVRFEDEHQHEITYLVQTLDDKYRLAIHLFYYEQCSIKEIASILEEKESTIKTRLSRAKKLLKERWEDREHVR